MQHPGNKGSIGQERSVDSVRRVGRSQLVRSNCLFGKSLDPAAMGHYAVQEQHASCISKRAAKVLPPKTTFNARGARARDWSPDHPEGQIVCWVAENKLTSEVLHKKMVTILKDMPLEQLSYARGFYGFPEARQAMARMTSRTFMKGAPVDPDELIILSGAGAVLETLFHTLCDAGDGVLLPRPTYPTFLNDMEVRSRCFPALFDLVEPQSDNDTTTPSIRQQLDDAAAAAAAAGHPVRMLLLTNPNNPLGTVYQTSTMLQALKWCLDNNVHLLSDEVYANSVWDDSGPEFVSTAVLAARAIADGSITGTQVESVDRLLHTVFGLSKDFCASGLRVGVLHTRNVAVRQVVQKLSYFHSVSNPTLWAVSKVLADDAFIDMYLAENKRRMKEAYKGLSDALAAANIPHVHATAAMFCWIDLRAGLLQPDWEGERELWEALVKAGVFLTKGEACKAVEPGFFRICWAWVPAAALPEMVRRIAALLADRAQLKQKQTEVVHNGQL